jgi:hypothetical protein
MNHDDFISEHKIQQIFKYQEEKDGNKTLFGWALSNKVNLGEPIVISSNDESYDPNSKEYEWSTKQGNTASTISDYKLWFKAMTGDDSKTFILKWGYNLEHLEQVRKRESPNYKKGEGLFLLNLAYLIEEGREFTQFSRIYRLIRN